MAPNYTRSSRGIDGFCRAGDDVLERKMNRTEIVSDYLIFEVYVIIIQRVKVSSSPERLTSTLLSKRTTPDYRNNHDE